MGQYNWKGDFNVQGAIKHNGVEISYSGGSASFAVLEEIDDNGAGTYEFPPNILPVRYYSNDDDAFYYFDYENGEVLNEQGEAAGNLTDYYDNRVCAYFNSEPGVRVNDDRLDYILGDGPSKYPTGLNTYNWYHSSAIPIDDLTNIPPAPTEPEELYCESVGSSVMYIKFSKGFIPSRIDWEDTSTGTTGWVTFTYDEAAADPIQVDECSDNCSGNEWGVLGEESTADDYSYMGIGLYVSLSGNPSNISLTGTFTYKPGDWEYWF